MIKNILLVKESKAGEQRVTLVPTDVGTLVAAGYLVFIEPDAGKNAGFPDDDYLAAGADIRHLEGDTKGGYQKLFSDIDIIVRAKRPNRSGKILENNAIAENTIMIGTLDPLEKSQRMLPNTIAQI